MADGSFDTLQLNDGPLFTEFTEDCDRIESGLQASNVETEGYPIASMGTADQFRLGQYVYDDRLRDCRFPMVDEERGLVRPAYRLGSGCSPILSGGDRELSYKSRK